MKHSVRYYAVEFLHWLSDKCMDAANFLSGYNPKPWTEEEQMAFSAKLRVGLQYPCPICKRRGWVPTNDDDRVICPLCHGTGLDILALGIKSIDNKGFLRNIKIHPKEGGRNDEPTV